MTKISLEYLLKRTDSIYEAVAVMFRRARQINDEQKMQIEMEMDMNPSVDSRENDDIDDVEIDRDALEREHKKYPKPSRMAIDEMVDGKIKFEYIDTDGEKQEKE